MLADRGRAGRIAALNKNAAGRAGPNAWYQLNSPADALARTCESLGGGVKLRRCSISFESRDVYVSSGSACSSEASHTLTAMGPAEKRRVDTALRVSFPARAHRRMCVRCWTRWPRACVPLAKIRRWTGRTPPARQKLAALFSCGSARKGGPPFTLTKGNFAEYERDHSGLSGRNVAEGAQPRHLRERALLKTMRRRLKIPGEF